MGVITILDQKTMENLKNLSDSQLRELVTVIAQAAGVDGRKAAALFSNTNELKKTLSQMDPSQAEALIRTAGKEKSEEIYRIISGR